jgi:hypothetical protein
MNGRKKNLQLIQNFENEIRLNVNSRSKADYINIKSDTALATHADRIAIIYISD